ncbi:MAG: hypothetical protein RLN90_03530 [Balneolaceae bacterium]
MRKLLILIVLVLVSFPLSAQEKYFHELKGMEDSTGTTHLFYRMYERIPYQCSMEETGELLYNSYNNIYHLNTSTNEDSLKFNHYYKPWCLNGYADAERISDYDFYSNDPSKWIIQSIPQGCYPYPISDFKGRSLNLPLSCIVKQNLDSQTNLDNENGFLLSNNEDSLYYNGLLEGGGFRVEIKDDFFPDLTVTNEEEYGFYNNYMSSVRNELGVAKIHPKIDSLFYTKNY